MKRPWDISASNVSRSIFIRDRDNQCIWRVRMPGKDISRWEMKGIPYSIAMTPSDDLIVVVYRDGRFRLDIYSCLDANRTQSIPLSTELEDVLHAVQSPNGNYIISYKTVNSPDVYLISELSIEGMYFIRTFDPRSTEWINLMHWVPDHLSFDGDGHLFAVDRYHGRVYMLTPQLNDPQIMLHTIQHGLHGPDRLCYAREKHLLIVGETGYLGEPGRVSVFNLRPTSGDDKQ